MATQQLLDLNHDLGSQETRANSENKDTSISESLESSWAGAVPERKGSMGCPILAIREISFAFATSGFWRQGRENELHQGNFLLHWL